MRARTANPHNEAHGKPLRVYDWVAPAGTDPVTLAAVAEAALGLKLFHRGDGLQDGYIATAAYADGVHVEIVLYEACADPACQAGHEGVTHRKAATPNDAALNKAKADVGEHTTLRLGRGAVDDLAVLAALQRGAVR